MNTQEQFYGRYFNIVFNGKQPNDGKTWTQEDLEMLDACTSSSEGINAMARYFKRSRSGVRRKQRQRAEKRLKTLIKLRDEAKSMGNMAMAAVFHGEIEFLKKFLNK
jgi:hypothetical protein